jgi:hybrid cluster-associated redox disulfide protein
MAKITKDMTIHQVLKRDINVAPLFFEMGMHCVGCPSASGEKIEQACMVHGIDAEVMLAKLNEFFGE